MFLTSAPILWAAAQLGLFLQVVPILGATIRAVPLLGLISAAKIILLCLVIAAPVVAYASRSRLSPARLATLALAAVGGFALSAILGAALSLLLTTLLGQFLEPIVIFVLAGTAVIGVWFAAVTVREARTHPQLAHPASVWVIRAVGGFVWAAGSVSMVSVLWGPHDSRLMNLQPIAVLAMCIAGFLYALTVTLAARLIDRPGPDSVASRRIGEQALPADGVSSEQ
jgi:hypothetical protein